jgi:hypothetical protein
MEVYAVLKSDGRVDYWSSTDPDPGNTVLVPESFSDPRLIYHHDGTWALLPDNPDGLTEFDPVSGEWIDPRSTQEIKEAEQRAFDDLVNAERAKRIRAGTSVSVTGLSVPVALRGRDEDQRTLQGLCTAAQIRIGQGDITTLTKYRDMGNVDHMMTPPQIVEMWSLGSAWVSSVYQASWGIKDLSPRPADHTDDALWPA